jgi:hypothetical protein
VVNGEPDPCTFSSSADNAITLLNSRQAGAMDTINDFMIGWFRRSLETLLSRP